MAQNNYFRNLPPFLNILILSALALISAGIFSLLALAGIQLFWGIPVFSNPVVLSDYTNPELLNPLKFMQAMYSVGLFIIPCFVFLKLAGENSFDFLKMKAFPAILSILLALLIMVVVQPLVELTGKWNAAFPFPEAFGIADWIKQTENSGEVVTKIFLKANSFSVLLLNVVILAFLPALGEEFFFRGMIQTFMIKAVKNIYVGIIITAIIFSAFHFQFMGFLPRMLLGIILGCIFAWSGNIWLSVFAHFLNNGAAVALDYLSQKNMIDQKQLENTASDNVLIIVLGLALLGMLLFALYKQRKEALQSQ